MDQMKRVLTMTQNQRDVEAAKDAWTHRSTVSCINNLEKVAQRNHLSQTQSSLFDTLQGMFLLLRETGHTLPSAGPWQQAILPES